MAQNSQPGTSENDTAAEIRTGADQPDTAPVIGDSAEEAEFRAEVRAFLAANTQRRRESSPWEVHFVTSAEKARAAFERGRAWQGTMFRNRMAGLTYPVELGGRGGRAWHERIYAEEAAGWDASPRFIGSTIAMLGPTLMKHASEDQKAHFVPRLLSGEYSFCQLFSEPGAGSDLAGLATRAIRDGDEFVVSGQKVWNSSAQFCNWGMILVRTNPDVPKHRGITFLLLDMTSPGIEVRPLVQPTGASEFNEVFLNEVRVPVANVIGEIDGGWGPARTVMSNESAFIGSSPSVGAFSKVMLLAEKFGRRNDPVIRDRMADLYTREWLLRVMGARIMAAVRQRQVPPMDPSILKLFVALNRVASGNLAMELAGPSSMAADSGNPDDAEVFQWLQAELLGRFAISIGGGTNEVQKNNLSERALGLPKELRNDHELAWKDVPRG